MTALTSRDLEEEQGGAFSRLPLSALLLAYLEQRLSFFPLHDIQSVEVEKKGQIMQNGVS
ncbi:MAG: hypothetical protein SD837_11415 [Candidatus Electrothrix scaldis]|nr:MAG: hypothetical protein SD837_11415 [Candidatus Electrothrix sp. GW3-3]